MLSGQQGYRRAGIHHYISQLLNNFPQENGQFEITIFANNHDDLTNWPANKIVPSRWPTDNPLIRVAWEQLAWPSVSSDLNVDLLHSMAFVSPVNSPSPTIVTVYDLSFLYFPEQYPLLRRMYLTNFTRRSCLKAKRIVTISEAGRQDIHHQFGIELDKIDVIPPGVGSSFVLFPESRVNSFREERELPEKLILHVGTLQPRKNLPILIEAMALMKRPDVLLTLLGGKGWYYDEIFARVQKLGLENQVQFVGYAPGSELPSWYNAASLLVLPSLYEGFGMPALEAMACGTPVIAANNSSLPEVVGEAGRLFDPEDPVALAEHIVTVLDDPEIAATMRQKGLKQAKTYTWTASGQKLKSTYMRVLAEI